MEKLNLIVLCTKAKWGLILLCCCLLSSRNNAQEYVQLMEALQEKMESQKEFEICVEQKVYYNGVEAKEERMRTHTIGKQGRLLAETPQYKLLQNEKAYLLIQKEQQVIYLSQPEEALEPEAVMAANFQQWNAGLQQYVERADSIVLLPDAKSHLFVIYHSQQGGTKARVKFDKRSGLPSWMDVTYSLPGEESVRTEVFYDYNFSPVFLPNLFDENRFVSFEGSQPKGKMDYRNYRVITH